MSRFGSMTAIRLVTRRISRQKGWRGMLSQPTCWSVALAASVGILLSQMWLPDARPPFGVASGLAHILGFHAVATLALLARPQAGVRLLLILIVFAVVVEAGQWFVPTRTVDPIDLAFNFSGVALAWLQWGIIRRLNWSAGSDTLLARFLSDPANP